MIIHFLKYGDSHHVLQDGDGHDVLDNDGDGLHVLEDGDGHDVLDTEEMSQKDQVVTASKPSKPLLT